MTGIPAAATAVIAAALDDYRLTTPTDRQTPRGAAERAVEQLLSSGWAIHIPAPSKARVPCPCCGLRHLVTRRGLIRRHGAHANPCPGSGQPARQPRPAEQQTTA
ncbi:hypothetical protein [Streptomyces luteogriseus]|uniref:hypothetical protein n=1 Tax=Streptomyces luteogriseus TaxID=68233 RepID=UPI00371A9418